MTLKKAIWLLLTSSQPLTVGCKCRRMGKQAQSSHDLAKLLAGQEIDIIS